VPNDDIIVTLVKMPFTEEDMVSSFVSLFAGWRWTFWTSF